MNKVALLIAVSEYRFGFESLMAAVKDVEAVKGALQHERIAGFETANISTMVNPGPQAMREAIALLFANRAKDDLILLYFSGHGLTDDRGSFYLATPSTKRDLPQATAIDASYIHSLMENSRSKRQVVILDCCFSGAFGKGMAAKGKATNIAGQLSGQGRAVLTSSSSTEYSFEQKGADLSVYTQYLVEGLRTGAADLDGDGLISIDELHEYTKQKVKEASPAMDPKIYLVEQGYKISLAKAPTDDPRLNYRRMVTQYANQGEISFVARNILNEQLQRLNLDQETAQTIESQVLHPYREYRAKLQRFEHVVNEELRRNRVIDKKTYREIKNYQRVLGLRDQDVAKVESLLEKRLIEDAEKQASFWDALSGKASLRIAAACSVVFTALIVIGFIWYLPL
ncbi:MAG: caspase family protein, partial [Cyanobacteria bacterium P01_C01_bin.73]